GFRATFANPFTAEYFEAVNSGRWRHSATTTALLSGGIPPRMLEDLQEGRAVFHDVTGETLRERGYDVEPVAPEEAGRRLARLAAEHHFTLFEHFLTDKAGHAQDWAAARHWLAVLDAFLGGVLDEVDLERTLLMIISDHGNVEDLTVRTHTMNPVPAVLAGRGREQAAARLRSLVDVTPAILALLKGEGGAVLGWAIAWGAGIPRHYPAAGGGHILCPRPGTGPGPAAHRRRCRCGPAAGGDRRSPGPVEPRRPRPVGRGAGRAGGGAAGGAGWPLVGPGIAGRRGHRRGHGAGPPAAPGRSRRMAPPGPAGPAAGHLRRAGGSHRCLHRARRTGAGRRESRTGPPAGPHPRPAPAHPRAAGGHPALHCVAPGLAGSAGHRAQRPPGGARQTGT